MINGLRKQEAVSIVNAKCFFTFYLQFSGLKARRAAVLIRLVIKVLFNDACLMESPESTLDGLRNLIVKAIA